MTSTRCRFSAVQNAQQNRSIVNTIDADCTLESAVPIRSASVTWTLSVGHVWQHSSAETADNTATSSFIQSAVTHHLRRKPMSAWRQWQRQLIQTYLDLDHPVIHINSDNTDKNIKLATALTVSARTYVLQTKQNYSQQPVSLILLKLRTRKWISYKCCTRLHFHQSIMLTVV